MLSQKVVIPAKAAIKGFCNSLEFLDSRLRGNDGNAGFSFFGELMIFVFMLSLLAAVAGHAASSALPGQDGPGSGTVSGRFLTAGGEPLAGGMACFFSTKSGPAPDHERYWRVPDYTKRIDGDGKFSVTLPEGEYFLGAIRKVSGTSGPPRDGDSYFISSNDSGLPVTYSVKNAARVDLGTLAKAVPFKSSTVRYGDGITAISGFVLDNEGKAVEGAYVFGFTTAKKGVRPLFVSDPTGKDGAFMLRLHDEGTFYLKVRSVYGGGPPAPGEMFGLYGAKQPEGITIKKGERLTGFTIRVANFAGRGPQQRANGHP